MTRSLIVLPDDSAKPMLDAIDNASRTLRVKMFVFSDSSLLKAVIAARRRGVNVKVMLNPARRDGEHDNDATRTALERADIRGQGLQPFLRPHARKVDGRRRRNGIREIAQLGDQELHRDAGLRGHHDAAARCGGSRRVLRGRLAPPLVRSPHKSHLIWCPGPGRDRICQFIDQARHRLFVQNERYQDMVIVERLVRASRRGVKVDVMARAPHTLKREKLVEGVGGLRIMDDVGIKIHKLKHLKLHGKMLLADGVAAIVGSINFAAGSLDGRRELAIEVRDDDVVDRLHKVARHDWEHSHPLDLSDEGLLADLEARIADSAQLLGLEDTN